MKSARLLASLLVVLEDFHFLPFLASAGFRAMAGNKLTTEGKLSLYKSSQAFGNDVEQCGTILDGIWLTLSWFLNLVLTFFSCNNSRHLMGSPLFVCSQNHSYQNTKDLDQN